MSKLYNTSNVDTQIECLKQVVYDGLHKLYGENLSKEVIERAEYELQIFEEYNYTDYLLVVWDIVNFMRNNDIYVGTGRGSSGNSLVNYALGMTEVDPI